MVALPTAWLLYQGQIVRTQPVFLYVVMSALGVLFSLLGAYWGERIQLGAAPKATA